MASPTRQGNSTVPLWAKGPSLAIIIVIGLWAFMATTPVFPLAPRLLDRAATGVNVAAFTLVAGALACVLGLVGVVRFFKTGKSPMASVAHARLALVSYAVVTALGIPLMPLMAIDWVAVLFGAALGACIAAAFMAWGMVIVCISGAVRSFGQVLAVTGSAMALAAATDIALYLVPASLALPAVIVLLAIAAGSPIAILSAHAKDAEASDHGRATPDELAEMSLGVLGMPLGTATPEPASSKPAPRLGSVARALLLPVAILVLYTASQLVSASIEGYHDLVAWGILASPLVALASCVVREDSRRVGFALRTLLPFLGVVLLGVVVILPDANEAGVAAVGAQALSFSYGLVLLSLGVYFSCARLPHGSVAICVLAAAILSLIMVLPHLTLSLVHEMAVLPALVALLVVALCLLVSSPSLVAWDGAFAVARAASEDTPTLASKVADACDAMADAYGLSPREREIVQYLGRGYGPRYLATILPIKENTIRSHVRNIYAKADVHTQAELLELIDSLAEGNGCADGHASGRDISV